MTGATDIRVTSGTPIALLDMIWEEFFASRGRGISLSAHAPWLADRAAVRCIAVFDHDDVLGGLVLKDRKVSGEAPISMIGFVCVHPRKRGSHISRQLLKAAIDDAQDRGIAGLILWTRAPQVYAHFGFQPDPRDVFMQFSPLSATCDLNIVAEPTNLGARGLPAFAIAAHRVRSPVAAATVLHTYTGPAVAEWTGTNDDVIALISSSFSEAVWINALSSDSLPQAMASHFGSPRRVVRSARYALPLGRSTMMDLPGIRLLDRI